eukprot:gene34965-42342_t
MHGETYVQSDDLFLSSYANYQPPSIPPTFQPTVQPTQGSPNVKFWTDFVSSTSDEFLVSVTEDPATGDIYAGGA